MLPNYYQIAKSVANKAMNAYPYIPSRRKSDLIQECAQGAWESQRSYKPGGNASLKTWMWRAAWHKAQNFACGETQKKLCQARYFPPDKMDRFSAQDQSEPPPDLYSLILPTKLREKDREIWRLYLDNDLSYLNTSKLTGTCPQAVGQRVQKIIAHLKKFYNNPP